jgi:hypothetical protein
MVPIGFNAKYGHSEKLFLLDSYICGCYTGLSITIKGE